MAQSSKILPFRKQKNEPASRRARGAHSSRNLADSRRTRSESLSKRSQSSSDELEDQEPRAAVSRRTQSKSEAKRRQRTKAKAEKMFDRQFGKGSDASAAKAASSAEGAPRAALYKGQMGSSQKRATRMQRGTSLSLPSFSPGEAVRQGASRAVESASITTGTVKAITAVLCVVLVCAFLYTPLQQYYTSQREYAKLSAEYASIESRNDALDVQNDILVSDAGVEDTVRQRFGYVKPGESMGVVVGLSENATDGLRGSEKIEANVLSSTVKAPEEWYTPFLDALFGVE